MSYQSIDIILANGISEGAWGQFSSSIDGVDVVFLNGRTVCYFEFTNNDSEIIADPLTKVKIGDTSVETAYNLTTFIEDKGYTPASLPNYNEVGRDEDTNIYFARVIYLSDKIVNRVISYDSIGVTIKNNTYVVPVEPIRKKYTMQYRNAAGDDYKLDIFQKGFYGELSEIFGRVYMNRNEVKSHFEPIRGQGLDIEVEASTAKDFQEFYAINETDFPVRFYRNNAIIFDGYLKPDGVFQSFTSDVWKINLQAVDGLGFLTDLSFVKNNGSAFAGKMSALDIIANCLKRSGVQATICTYVDMGHYGMLDSSDVLKETVLNLDRFIRKDDNTTMSCLEVLTSILGVLNACITQHLGRWFIYRCPSFYANSNPLAFAYDSNLNPLHGGTINFLGETIIGSQIDNIYPHHCSSNQVIEVKGAVSAFRINYKYGFIGSILGNGNLYHEAGTKVYADWTVNTWTEAPNTGFLVIAPESEKGISFKTAIGGSTPAYQPVTALQSTFNFDVIEGYSFEFKPRFISYGFPVQIFFSVTVSNITGVYSLQQDGSWIFNALSSTGFNLINADIDGFPNSTGELVDTSYERVFSINSQPLPAGAYGKIEISMRVPFKPANGPDPVLVDVKSIELINTFEGNNVVGEFHTASRINRPSSIVKENKTVNNGDNTNTVYQGALYQSDKTTLTRNWYRKTVTPRESKPLLRINAEDELRISQIPTKVFTGDVFGYCYYLKVFRINNIPGKFMPIQWEFDTYANITKMKLLELYCPELNDVNYAKTDDYGETVKPTIV